MKGFMYAYAISIFHTDKKINVFKVKDLERIMHYNGIQFQRDELVPSSTFKNILHKLQVNKETCLVISLAPTHVHIHNK